MSNSIGGYVYFSTIKDREKLIQHVLQAGGISSPDTLEVWLPDGEDTNPTDLPTSQALQDLAHAEEGAIFINTEQMPDVGFWFEPPIDDYQTVNVWGDDYILGAISTTASQTIDSFVEHWLALCQGAEFGFFGRYAQMIEREYRDELLPALLKKDVLSLMTHLPAYWLVYLGPDLAQQWQRLDKNIEAVDRRVLLSGAIFIRTSVYFHE